MVTFGTCIAIGVGVSNATTNKGVQTMKEIRLFTTPKGWMADFGNDAEILSVFGTSIIPTAFTSRATASVVRAEIARLNPECNVIVDPSHNQ